jgi:hypothetical protein
MQVSRFEFWLMSVVDQPPNKGNRRLGHVLHYSINQRHALSARNMQQSCAASLEKAVEANSGSAMVAGAPSSHVSAASCCIVYAIACPAILFTTQVT